MQTEKAYIAIDLKSFYASVECVQRGLNPLTTNLVVADPERSEKTICLAVSPSLKASCGIGGRARLFEVVQKVREANAFRRGDAPEGKFRGSSFDDMQLKDNPGLELDYIVAPPRMALYMQISTQIYQIYLHHVSAQDIHVYSIDEVFIDATAYLGPAHKNARDFAMLLIREVLEATGITATAGIGSNLYLSKIAMDIEAKHIEADADGVRIAELDEMSYRRKLWDHQPLTDFWRVGPGYASKLEAHGMYTMGDVARMSVQNEDLLYSLFGVYAELLIDHAWGWEPCTIAQIQAYRPESNSISTGQVLSEPYDFEKGRLVVREMTDQLVLELVDRGLVTDQMVLTVGYDVENLMDPQRKKAYRGSVTTDRYGRQTPKPAHGTVRLGRQTSSSSEILRAVTQLYEDTVDPGFTVRRMYVVANHVVSEDSVTDTDTVEQLDMFTDYEEKDREKREEDRRLSREKSIQRAVLGIKKKFGKNAILKGMNFEEGATARERNSRVGGHKA